MSELLTAAQMRGIEQAAITSGTVTGLELMERAGTGVVQAILQEWPGLSAETCQTTIVCGPGNNGGDGFVVARLLNQLGLNVLVFMHGDPQNLPSEARKNYTRWTEIGEVHKYDDPQFNPLPNPQHPFLLIIDAVFGTGLSRPVIGFQRFGKATQAGRANPTTPTRKETNSSHTKIVSIDVPSGLDADSGQYLQSAENLQEDAFIRADLTVTFHRAKVGHYLAQGPAACGKIVIKDIGL